MIFLSACIFTATRSYFPISYLRFKLTINEILSEMCSSVLKIAVVVQE